MFRIWICCVLASILSLAACDNTVGERIANPMPSKNTSSITTGVGVALEIVDGNPAMSYSDEDELYYIRAEASDGSSWGSRFPVDSGGGIHTSLAVIDGNPAIVYNNSGLYYVRASDSDGDTWNNSPVQVYSGTIGASSSLVTVNGRPAIAFASSGSGGTYDLRYIRASDTDGDTWPGSSSVLSGDILQSYGISMYVVAGYPAVAYCHAPGNLYVTYRRATDANGTYWGGGIYLDSNLGNGTPLFPSLTVITNNPAVAYYATGSGICYVRASDTTGSSGNWGSPSIIINGGYGMWSPFLWRLLGKPAVAYTDEYGVLKFVKSSDTTGSSWGGASTLSSSGSGLPPVWREIPSGHIGIGYEDSGVSFLYTTP